jgi:hypothetical protein
VDAYEMMLIEAASSSLLEEAERRGTAHFAWAATDLARTLGFSDRPEAWQTEASHDAMGRDIQGRRPGVRI